MEILNLPTVKEYGANTYLLKDADTAILVDPAAAFDPALVPQGLDGILLTHAHFDHFLTLDEWVSATGAKVYIGAEDAASLPDPDRNGNRFFFGTSDGYPGEVTPIETEEPFKIGSLTVLPLAVPGHSPGSVAYEIENALFSGDVIFADGNIGRWDLYRGDYRTLGRSVHRILSLPEDVRVYPGHGPSVTVGEVLHRHNR